MVSIFVQWLLMPLLATGFCKKETPLHPFHVSVTEINHNSTAKTLEITCKIYTDDFESVLSRNYQTKVDLIHPPDKSKMDTLVKNYLFQHLQLRVNGRPVTFTYIGFENDKEAAYGYIEVENITSVGRLEIIDTILYDLFDDQIGIIHAIVNGNRKSTKLNYPDKSAIFEF